MITKTGVFYYSTENDFLNFIFITKALLPY
jgi:hypothetical protein